MSIQFKYVLALLCGALSVGMAHGTEISPSTEVALVQGNYGPNAGRLADTAAPGWTLKIRLADGIFQNFYSTASAPAIEEGKEATVLTWKGLGEGPAADLSVHLTRRLQGPGAAWHLEVENNGDAALWDVIFPYFKTAISSDDMIVMPTVNGRLHPANRPLSYRSTPRKHYPSGSLSMQCAGFYGENGGVYIGVHDPFASNKRLEMSCRNGRFDMLWRWLVPDMGVPGKGWEMPGEVLIRPFDGDWFDIAQIYRAWVSEKAGWWPRGEQVGRPDTPQWFKDTPVWIVSNGPWPYNKPPIPLDQAAAKIKKFAVFMDDIPCAVHWYNWHKIGFDDNYPNYFPTDEGFPEAVREVQAAGVKVMPYINAHIWDMDTEEFSTLGRPGAVKDANGNIPVKSYAGNRHAPMCPTTPVWQKTVSDIVTRIAGPEAGADSVYLDQVSAQASMECFDKTHGHPIGGGCSWTTQGYWPMLDAIRKKLPDTALTSESAAEPYVNRFDGYLNWVGFREGSGVIPLFHAVYVGQIQLFGRLYDRDSWKGVEMRAKTAQALAWGEQLGWIIPEVVDDPIAGPYLKKLARMRYMLTPYLATGRMARPPKLETDGSQIRSNWQFTGGRNLIVTSPTVFTGAWMRPDGQAVALMLINADDKPRTVTLPFDAAEYGLKGALRSCQWATSVDPVSKPAWQPSKSTWKREITLAPMAAVAIEVEQQK